MRSRAYVVILGVFTFVFLALVFNNIAIEAVNRTLTASEVKNIVDAPKKHSFVATGTTMSLYKGKPLSIRIKQYHKKPDKCRIEYLSAPLNGVVVCNKGKCMWRYDPKLDKTILMERSACEGNGNRLDLLQKNYRLEESGKTTVAGRSVQVIDVKNKRGGVTKRLWVDRTSHVVLKTSNYDSSGKVQSSTAFDSIKYTEGIPDSLFTQPDDLPAENCMRSKLAVGTATELSKYVGFRVKVPAYIPSGYKLDGYRLYECTHKSDHESAYIRYTNGLKSISIFESRDDVSCGTNGLCSDRNRGRCMMGKSLTGNSAMVTVDGISIAIIADLKTADLERIAKSMK